MANETIEVLRIPGTLFPRGPYDETASYKFLNIVESGGSGYVCLQPCTGIPVTNTAYWFKFVFKGDKGDAFTYADLTAEQKAELVRDATAAAQAAASSAQSAADDAAAVLQKFNTIKAAIDAIDPTSTEGSIQTLAAKQGVLEANLAALGPEISNIGDDTKALAAEIGLESSSTTLTLADANSTNNCYINTDGTRAATANWTSYKFSADGLKSVSATLKTNSLGYLAIAFYSVDIKQAGDYNAQNFISGVAYDSTSTKEYTATVPDGCKTVVISNRNASLATPSASIQKKVYSSRMGGIAQDIDDLRHETSLSVERSTSTLADADKTTHYYIDDSSGEWSYSANWTSYIFLANGCKNIQATIGTNSTSFRAISFYSADVSTDTSKRADSYLISSQAFSKTGTEFISINVPEGCVSFVISNRDETKDSPTASIEKVVYTSRFDDIEGHLVPTGGESGEVLTPEGWSALSTMLASYLAGYVTSADLASELASYITSVALDTALTLYQKKSEIASTLAGYMQKVDYTSNINEGAITPAMLSQSVLDLIAASGGGTITNLPDNIDIETNGNGYLQLKGGGVVRFRAKSNGADNLTELARCKATGLPIQVENPINFGNANGSIPTIDLDGCVLVFVGEGMFRNCEVTGSVEVRAGRTQIFDNVYFHKWYIGNSASNAYNKDNLYNMYLANTTYDTYNRLEKTVAASVADTAYNPFFTALTIKKVGSFLSPVLSGGKYIYTENGTNALLTFTLVDGNIKIPICKDYLFLDGNGDVVESTYNIKTKQATYAYVAPEDLQITRLIYPVMTRVGKITSAIYPEWWGAVANDSSVDSNEAIQWAMTCGGSIDFAPNANYMASGNIRMYGSTEIFGHCSSVTLTASSSSYCMFEIETLTGQQDYIVIHSLVLDGNKSNNTTIQQDGIYADFLDGIQPFTTYCINDTYWYSMIVQNFRGSGICVAVPGHSHLYSCKLQYNAVDGITWDNEHFTLNNVTSIGNGRHGAYASGNHWRIIGGAFAHNGAGDNIHCNGAFEAQIIGCSCIDCGKFVASEGGAYAADATATYGYSYVGAGNGTHDLVGGNGINIRNSTRILLIGVRFNNHNANGLMVYSCEQIYVTSCLFNKNNMSKGNFQDIQLTSTSARNVHVVNTTYDGFYVSNSMDIPMSFGSSNGAKDWNNLLNDLTGYGEGLFTICDYYNAQNRPSGAGTYLEGTIHVKYGSSKTIGRTYIRLMDETGKIFTRYCNINLSSGAYTNDTGWNTFAPS